jgi:peptidoglycan hydrolase-like protein with peptidoglycan-binding domain
MVWFPHVQAAVNIITAHFGIQATTYPSHDDGLNDGNAAAPLGQLASDLWPRGAPNDQTQMIQVMNWVWANRDLLNVRYVVGNGQKIKNRGHETDAGPWRQMNWVGNPGDARYKTNNHFDHCHVTYMPTWQLSNPNWNHGQPPSPSSGVLQAGDSGPAVTRLQQRLNLTGLYHLVVDGDFGPGTSAAVKDFQLRSHLAADGVVGPQTQAALDARLRPTPVQPNPFSGWSLMEQGSSGPHVLVWQKVLNALHATPQLVKDGDFGPSTVARTKDLQHLAKISEDGRVGSGTYNAAYFFLVVGKIDASKL